MSIFVVNSPSSSLERFINSIYSTLYIFLGLSVSPFNSVFNRHHLNTVGSLFLDWSFQVFSPYRYWPVARRGARRCTFRGSLNEQVEVGFHEVTGKDFPFGEMDFILSILIDTRATYFAFHLLVRVFFSGKVEINDYAFLFVGIS